MSRKRRSPSGKRPADTVDNRTRSNASRVKSPSALKERALTTADIPSRGAASQSRLPVIDPATLSQLTPTASLNLAEIGTALLEHREGLIEAFRPFRDPEFVARLGEIADKAAATHKAFSLAFRSPARDVLDAIGSPHPDLKPANIVRPLPAPSESPPNSPTRSIASVGDIGREVRASRRAMGMTQQRFADLAGVGRRFLIELEQGKPSLEIGRVLAVCHAAGIKLGFVA